MNVEVQRYDTVVIGSGGGGLRAALAAKEAGANVAIVTKAEPSRSGGTLSAHYSFCTILPDPTPGDSAEVFAEDIMRSGERISDAALVRVLAEQAYDAVRYLQGLGVKFDTVAKDDPRLDLGWLAGHTYARAVHIGNSVGREVVRALLKAVRRMEIPVHPFVMCIDLILQDGVLWGVLALDMSTGDLRIYQAPSVILATGGGSQCYELNTNPFEATGDGYGMAYRAGAELVDMEFVQHYPTVLVDPPGTRGLMFNSGILIPKGARLLNNNGEDFWDRYDTGPLKDATRDVMCRVMAQELAAGNGTERGGLFISTQGIDAGEMPQMQQRLLNDVGLPKEADRLEVAPGAHYFMGGLRIDARTATSIPGLFAAGECAGGIHGANRLAGNALSENQVFGAIAGKEAAAHAARWPLPNGESPRASTIEAVMAPFQGLTGRAGKGENPQVYWKAVQQLMQRNVGATRTAAALSTALDELRRLRVEVDERVGTRSSDVRYNRDLGRALELRNLIDTGILVARAALAREESRGAHLRLDFPENSSEWACSLVVHSPRPGEAEELVALPRGDHAGDGGPGGRTSITCRIARKDVGERGYRMQTYTLPYRDGMTVLDCMRYIADELDGSLAFYDHACKRGFCGSCLVRVNGRKALSCRILVPSGELRIEPALETVKDFWPANPS